MMTATTCPSKHHLRSLTLGGLPDQESDALFEHLRSCVQCRSELETIENAEDSLIASLRAHDGDAGFDAEPDCQVAVAKALGALALASDGSAESPALPQTIGEYEIVRPLGRGGMGSVYLARHTKLGREVALKVLASHRLADARMRERFENEMRAVGRLSHPNVVTAHDAREVDGTAVLVTEFIDGLDLGQLLQRTGPLAVNDAAEIARQVAVALEYTSSQGFVHRDVKPSNIMLSASGEVKLLDLGLARWQFADSEEAAQAELTATGQAMGTADYVAPEQVTDSRHVDARADVYALGCTLFKLLTGNAPFADEQHVTAFAKMTAHVSTPPPSLQDLMPGLPKSLVQLVAQMLAKNPGERPQTPLAVAERLRSATAGSDLQKLALHAQQLQPLPASPRASSTASLKTKPLLRRTVSMPIAIGAAFAALLVGLCLGVIITIKSPDGTTTKIDVPDGAEISIATQGGQLLGNTPTDEFNWIPFTGNKFTHFLDGEQAIVLQITAAWSIQSQINQKEALDRPAVRSFIQEKRIVPMIADWTEESAEIAELLKELGQKSLPVTVVISEDKSIEPIVLHGLITESQLMDALVAATTNATGASGVEDALLNFDATSYRVQAGDLLSVRVEPLLFESVTLPVLDDGTLRLPLIPPVKVKGLTTGQIATLVRQVCVAAKVANANEPSVWVQLAQLPAGIAESADNTLTPTASLPGRPHLSLGILATAFTSDEFEAAEKTLYSIEDDSPRRPIHTEIGSWHPCSETLSHPHVAVHSGQNYILVSDSSADTIGWQELFGHLRATVTTVDPFGAARHQLALDFAEQLAKRVRDMTARNIGKDLAVILDGKVVAAARINSEFSSRAVLTGSFTAEKIRYLQEALNRKRVAPSNRLRNEPAVQHDPFGGSSGTFGDTSAGSFDGGNASPDPFGGPGSASSDAFGGGIDPFGGAGASSDPFGGDGDATADPFGGPGSNSDPFGGGGGAPDKPASTVSPDPQATTQAEVPAQSRQISIDDRLVPRTLWEVVHYLENSKDDGQRLAQAYQDLLHSIGSLGELANLTNALKELGRPASIKAVTEGLPKEAAWLAGPRVSTRTLQLDTTQVLADVGRLLDGFTGSVGVFKELVLGIEKDPNGPQINLQTGVLDHLGQEAYVVLPPAPSARSDSDSPATILLAVKVANVEALQTTLDRLEKYSAGSSNSCKLIDEYLILAPTSVIDAAFERRTAPEPDSLQVP